MSADLLSEQPSQAEALRQEQIKSDLEHVLRSPQGRRVLLSVLARCGVYRLAFTGDSEATSFRIGEQNVGLWLIGQLEQIGPTEYPRLLLEAAQRKMETEEAVHVVDADAE